MLEWNANDVNDDVFSPDAVVVDFHLRSGGIFLGTWDTLIQPFSFEMQKQLNEGRMFADLHLKSMTGRLGLLEPSCDDNPHWNIDDGWFIDFVPVYFS